MVDKKTDFVLMLREQSSGPAKGVDRMIRPKGGGMPQADAGYGIRIS